MEGGDGDGGEEGVGTVQELNFCTDNQATLTFKINFPLFSFGLCSKVTLDFS